ncbi:MAG: hypothetical protein P4M01_07935 [Acidobacteriota bacterium]|nr:hypothetical protein [Acidobacteriota bacterium]
MSLISANLAHRIVEGYLPWDRAVEFHVDAFLERYTLHDSMWIGLYTDCGQEDTAIAVIILDLVWNPSVSTPTSVCADWPLLLIRFKSVSAIQLSGFTNIGGTQRGISGVDVEHLSDEEAKTVFTYHYGALVSVRHFSLIEALFLSPEGNNLEFSRPVGIQ